MKAVFHIGLHKTATTWFQMVFYPHHKQIHNIINSAAPWDDQIVRELIKPPEGTFDAKTWRDQIELKVSRLNIPDHDIVMLSAERLSGHPASGGADRFLIARRIHEAFPEAKIFCALRKQTDMIDDMYRTMLLEGYSGTIERLLVDKSWKTASPRGSFFDYLPLFERYVEAFGKANCLFMCHEFMLAEPEAYLTRLCEFIGVQVDLPPADVVRHKVNTGLPTVGIGILRRINAFRRTEYHPDPPVTLPDGLYSVMKGIFRQLPQRPKVLSDKQTQRIRTMYAESNAVLAKHIDGDNAEYLKNYST